MNPCLNGGVCVNHEPFYRCDCPTGYFGENCEFLQQGQIIRLSMGALAAILVCLLNILSESSPPLILPPPLPPSSSSFPSDIT